jgi:hypothetical protein
MKIINITIEIYKLSIFLFEENRNDLNKLFELKFQPLELAEDKKQLKLCSACFCHVLYENLIDSNVLQSFASPIMVLS